MKIILIIIFFLFFPPVRHDALYVNDHKKRVICSIFPRGIFSYKLKKNSIDSVNYYSLLDSKFFYVFVSEVPVISIIFQLIPYLLLQIQIINYSSTFGRKITTIILTTVKRYLIGVCKSHSIYCSNRTSLSLQHSKNDLTAQTTNELYHHSTLTNHHRLQQISSSSK